MTNARFAPYAMALGAAAFFGASFPLSKLLLRDLGPLGLAGLLYLGSGIGTAALRMVRRRGEASLRRSDLGWLAGVILAGGVAGPILLLLGLGRTSAHVAALLANTETVFTMLLAVLFFGDFLLRREAAGAAAIVIGATMVAFAGAGPEGRHTWEGPLLLLGAGLAWGIDNNLSQKISGRDPLEIAAVKGIAAGLVNLALAAATEGLPRFDGAVLASSLAVGFVCYGLSVTLFLTALRHIGAARTSAVFATAPGFAIALSALMLGEVPGPWIAAGALLMIPGAWLLIRTEHAHAHVHEAMDHEHRHVHDEHHQHAHRGDEGPEPHSHPHRHEPLEHAHPHAADLHHRHGH